MNRISKRLDPRLDDMMLFHELTEAEAFEFDSLHEFHADVEKNMTVSGTTERRIDEKEAWFGIAPDASKPLDQRVSVLVSRMRSRGTTTPAFIKNVAQSFQYGDIDVIENVEPYVVKIVFKSIIGIPPNLDDFIEALEIVRPAHIQFIYEFKYNTWDMIEAFHKTWDEWEALDVTFEGLMTYSERNTQTQVYAMSEPDTKGKAMQTWAQ